MSGQFPFISVTHPPDFIAPRSQLAWDVSPTEKATADKLFVGLDTPKRGYIEGDVAAPFMTKSKLSRAELSKIWLAASIYSFPPTSHTMHRDLVDLNCDGRLTRDSFAVACHLMQRKLSGKEIPTTLPASLIPPSMRVVTAPTTSPFQQSSDFLNDLSSEECLLCINDKQRPISGQNDNNEGSTGSSKKEVGRLQHERITERQLSEMHAAQTERDRRIAQLTDKLTQKDALLEQAEANAAKSRKHARLELRKLQAKLGELTLSRDEHLRALEQAQSALQKATSRAAGADERSQSACEHEAELAEVHAELEGKKSELEAVRLRLADAENRCSKSKVEAGTLRTETQAAAGLVNMDVDRVMRRLMRAVEAEMASLRGDEKSIESLECRNED